MRTLYSMWIPLGYMASDPALEKTVLPPARRLLPHPASAVRTAEARHRLQCLQPAPVSPLHPVCSLAARDRASPASAGLHCFQAKTDSPLMPATSTRADDDPTPPPEAAWIHLPDRTGTPA